MDYMSIAEASETRCRMQALCSVGYISELTRFGKVWAIPKDAEKPTDPRNSRSIT